MNFDTVGGCILQVIGVAVLIISLINGMSHENVTVGFLLFINGISLRILGKLEKK